MDKRDIDFDLNDDRSKDASSTDSDKAESANEKNDDTEEDSDVLER